jgi:imidazoleglycerol-phosphate dehydratase
VRRAEIKRKTRETSVELYIEIDGSGKGEIQTGLPFLDHMLELLARHSRINLNLKAQGDLEVDAHHTVEDVGIVLGQGFREAIGDRKGINRFGFSIVPMDEALAMVSLDISGRPHLSYQVSLPQEKIGNFETDLFIDFFHAFVNHAAISLHIKSLEGRNAHHIMEAVFKGLAKAVEMAVKRRDEELPSTKGVMD